MVRVRVWITVSRRVTVTFNVFNKFKDSLSISKGAELMQPAVNCLVVGMATQRYKNLHIVIVIIIIMLGSPLLTDSP